MGGGSDESWRDDLSERIVLRVEQDALDTALACIRQMEIIVVSLKQLRRYVALPDTEMLEQVIAHAEGKIIEIGRKIVQ